MLPPIGIPTVSAAVAWHSPVYVATCQIAGPIEDPHMGTDIGLTTTRRYQLHVRFTNDGDQPVTRVVFGLNDGSMVVDAGDFAPGVTVDHTFDIKPDDADACNVNSATLADGTRWPRARDMRVKVSQSDPTLHP